MNGFYGIGVTLTNGTDANGDTHTGGPTGNNANLMRNRGAPFAKNMPNTDLFCNNH